MWYFIEFHDENKVPVVIEAERMSPPPGYSHFKPAKTREDLHIHDEPCKVCGRIFTTHWLPEVEKRCIETVTCIHCQFWLDKIAHADEFVRIEGSCYHIADERAGGVFRGFGGRRCLIEFFDGRRVQTTNLWHNGTIPQRFREQLPDNARWGKEHTE